ncbi:MAG TPA: YARHG domain-containing protein [Gemmatimonadaceae bacterium]|nr:YARHG domain-containing protein [Gemmatimonadaceae bacterium]
MHRLTIPIAVVAALSACVNRSDNATKGPAGTGNTSSATLAGSPPATATAGLDQWERFNYDSTTIAPPALASLPLAEVQRIRGIIFGRHGRIFQDSTLQEWLATRPWYHADSAFMNARLTERERENLEVVREAEAQKHPQIEPGDMRFYQNRVITTTMLGDHSPQDWEVLEAEVLANHGYVWDPESENDRNLQPGELQHYFDERYWYKPDSTFHASQLSAIERQNLDTIALAVMRQNKRSISFGQMNLFATTALSESMLANLPIAELRLLRNEIYARHGRRFQTTWLAETFRQQPWYTPRADFSDGNLSAVDSANIKLITSREQQLHESLSTKLLTPGDVSGLRNEDARRLRNEIYARHGRRFQDPKLQRYFASFSWYKPNGAFRENQLNETEKLNAILISQYEHGKFTEG